MFNKIIILLSAMIISTSTHAQSIQKDNIKMFPQAKEGFVRHVIEVPKTDNDYNHRVELLIGKLMLVDCNHHSLRGNIENVTLKGWGYQYIEVSNIQNGPSTLMACHEEKTEKFISITSGKDSYYRYNSRLPIVIYLPEAYEVRYRIWSASETTQKAKQR